MLTRNCVQKLLKPNDTNARITVFSNSVESADPISYKRLWLTTVRNSLGKGIARSKDKQFFEITSLNECNFNGFYTGEELLAKVENTFYKPVSIRVSLSGWPTRSWIIILEQDLNAING